MVLLHVDHDVFDLGEQIGSLRNARVGPVAWLSQPAGVSRISGVTGPTTSRSAAGERETRRRTADALRRRCARVGRP